jgi:hypothetical protein
MAQTPELFLSWDDFDEPAAADHGQCWRWMNMYPHPNPE